MMTRTAAHRSAGLAASSRSGTSGRSARRRSAGSRTRGRGRTSGRSAQAAGAQQGAGQQLLWQQRRSRRRSNSRGWQLFGAQRLARSTERKRPEHKAPGPEPHKGPELHKEPEPHSRAPGSNSCGNEHADAPKPRMAACRSTFTTSGRSRTTAAGAQQSPATARLAPPIRTRPSTATNKAAQRTQVRFIRKSSYLTGTVAFRYSH